MDMIYQVQSRRLAQYRNCAIDLLHYTLIRRHNSVTQQLSETTDVASLIAKHVTMLWLMLGKDYKCILCTMTAAWRSETRL